MTDTSREPRGIRNNNPGNLREFNIPWKGKTGSDGAFTTFDTPESGIRAMTKDIYGDFARKGKRTVRAITSEYAPPTENNTASYIDTVSQAMGVGADDELDLTDENQMLKLIRAKIGVENGKQPYTDEQLLTGIRAGLHGAPLPGPMTAAEAGVPNDPALPFTAADLAPANPFSLYEQRQMDVERERAEAGIRPDFLEAVGMSVDQDWILSWALASKPGYKPDPNFVMTPELHKQLTEGVPKEYWDHYDGAYSKDHALYLREQMLKDMETEQRLATLGWSGVALRLGTSLFDPVNIGTAALSGGVSLFATAGKTGRIAAGAVSGAAINTALSSVIVAEKPTATNMDLLYAAGLGGVFGALGSSLSRGRMTPEEEAISRAGRRMVDEVQTGTVRPDSASAARNYAVVDSLDATSSRLADAAEDVAERTAMGSIRFDAMATLKNSDNPLVSAFGGRLAEDAVGNADRLKATPIGATEEAGKLHRRMELEYQRSFETQFKAWAKRTGVRWNGDASARVRFGELAGDFVRNTDPTLTFDPEVAAHGAQIRTLMGRFNELANNPGLLDGTTRRPVRGFGFVAGNDNYLTRLWHGEKIAGLLERFGSRQVGRFVSRAITSAQPSIDRALASKLAGAVIARARRSRVGILGYVDPFGRDDLTYLRATLRDHGLDDAEVSHILGPLEPTGDAGAVSRGKHRIDISEGYRETMQDARTGEAVNIGLADFLERDATALFNAYSRTQSGWIAMSRLRIENPRFRPGIDPAEEEFIVDGITNASEFETFMRRVREAGEERGIAPARIDAEVRTMEYLYKSVVGIPHDAEGGAGAQALRMIRDYNFLRLMGQVGFAQIAEVFVGVSQLGFKAAFQGIPSFRALWRKARTGRLDDGFADEVEWITTAGSDWLRGKNLLRYDDSGVPLHGASGLLGTADNLMQRGKRGMSQISGMNAINTFIQRWGASSIMYHFNNLAKNPTKANMARMATVGLDEKMLKRVLGQIKAHAQTVPGTKGRKLQTMGLDRWTDTEAAYAFENAAFRLSRRIVQENDPGMMHRITANPLMKTLLQFRTFVLGAWTKQFLHNIHMRDFETFATFISASFAAGLSYVAQTHLQSVGRSDRDDFLDKRLTWASVGKAAFQRAGWASIIPMGVDTGMLFAQEDPVFDFRSTGQASDAILGNPTVSLLFKDLPAATGTLLQTALGDDLSQAEMRAMVRPLAFQNALPFTMTLNAMIGEFPKWIAEEK